MSSRLVTSGPPARRPAPIDSSLTPQVAAAIAASQLETPALRDVCRGVDGEDAELARAIHMSMSQEELRERERGYANTNPARAWVCPACTLVNDGSSGSPTCSVCFAPRPDLPPGCTPALDAGGSSRASGEGKAMDEGGGEGGGRGEEDGGEKDAVACVSDGRRAVGDALPSPSRGGGGGGTQDQRLKQRQQQVELEQKSEGEEDQDYEEDKGEVSAGSSPVSPEPQARVPRKGPLSARYELRGILHHLGQHAFAGHYVTDVRQDESFARAAVAGDRVASGETTSAGGKGSGAKGGVRGWKRHDDSVVAAVSEAKALDVAAQRTCYVCFYSLVVG